MPEAAMDPYMVEPAKSGRSSCKASKEIIEKGELRFGSLVDIGGHQTYHWRKLAYISPKQVANVTRKSGGIGKIGGFSALSGVQQKKVVKAFAVAAKKGEAVDKVKAKVSLAKEKATNAKTKAKEAKAKAKAKATGKGKLSKVKISMRTALKENDRTAPKAKSRVAPAPAAKGPAKHQRFSVAEARSFLDAIDKRDFKTAREQLEATPNLINVQLPGRQPALHTVAQAGQAVAVKLLLGKGADVNLRSATGTYHAEKTAYDIAHPKCKALVAPSSRGSK